MESIKRSLMFVFAVILIMTIVSASTPPDMPVLIYGKVVDKEGLGIPGQTVEVTWMNNLGEEITTKTVTMDKENAENLGFSDLVGYYKFEIFAIPGSTIRVKAGTIYTDFEAVTGVPTEVPNILLDSGVLGDAGIFKDVLDIFDKLFPGSEEVDSSGETKPEVSAKSSAEDVKGSENINVSEDITGEGKEDSSGYNDDVGNVSQGIGNSSEDIIEEDSQENDDNLSDDSPDAEGPSEDEDIDSSPYMKEIKYDLKIENDLSNVLDSSPLKGIVLNSAGLMTGYLSSERFYMDITILAVIFGIVVVFLGYRIFRRYGSRKQGVPLKVSIKNLDKLESKYFMDDDIPVLRLDDDVYEAFEIFSTHNNNIIVVLDGMDNIKGIVSKKDLLFGLGGFDYVNLKDTHLREVLNKKFVRSPPGRLGEFYLDLKDNDCSEIIVTKKDRFMGSVDYFDILRVLESTNFIIENPPTLTEAIEKDPLTVDCNLSLHNLLKILSEKRMDSAIVLRDKEAVGIVTLKDLIGVLRKGTDIKKNKVQNIMSTNLLKMTPGTSLYEASSKILERKFNQIPIMVGEKIYGVVTVKSLVDMYYRFIEEIKESKIDISASDKKR